jgi:glutathione peroxidase|tara:strand:+ start:7 stop:555 length:549 start_codon:yes stop_codon:yes gene_type:complete
MKQLFIIILLIIALPKGEEKPQSLPSFYDINANTIDGHAISMEKYRGKKVLIVNVASECGFTPQYEGLQRLHETHGKSLAVLGFPSNNFLWQEPGTNSEIQTFCKLNYGVTFQLFEKIHVRGRDQHPLYKWLSDSSLNGWNDKIPSWNFSKYLIDEKGKLLEYYNMRIAPEDTAITRHLRSN